jgi:hypothetical protein
MYQAYMMELEAEIAKLKEMNEELQKKQVRSWAVASHCFDHVYILVSVNYTDGPRTCQDVSSPSINL